MVDAIPPDELARWQALALHDGWGDDWHRTAKICETIHNGLLLLAAKMGHAVREKEVKHTRRFMPPASRPVQPKKTKRTKEPAQQPEAPVQTSTDAWMRRMAGF